MKSRATAEAEDSKPAHKALPPSDVWRSLPCGLAPTKPHRGKDAAMAALRTVVARDGGLTLSHFIPEKQLGNGDTAMVDLVRLAGTCHLFALKSLNKREMVRRNKVRHVLTELSVLTSLDHPFLQDLYATLQSDSHVHFLLAYCRGGDLFSTLNMRAITLRNRTLSEADARFYAAEVLLGLEYLHLQGVIYRDLKPENLLLRADGHIVLSDFDLSYKSKGQVMPRLVPMPQPPTVYAGLALGAPAATPSFNGCGRESSSSSSGSSGSSASSSSSNSSRFGSIGSSKKLGRLKGKLSSSPVKAKARGEYDRQERLLIVARSEDRTNSFVGTPAYVAPEVILGKGHSTMVDWWALGVLLYELLFGTTPFGARSIGATLDRIVECPLRFPPNPSVSEAARDLIRRLLHKDPSRRLGALAGAEEVKQHPWFTGVNWALMHTQQPPYVPQAAAGMDDVSPGWSSMGSMSSSSSGDGSSMGSMHSMGDRSTGSMHSMGSFHSSCSGSVAMSWAACTTCSDSFSSAFSGPLVLSDWDSTPSDLAARAGAAG